jgi:CBS domain-containing protein
VVDDAGALVGIVTRHDVMNGVPDTTNVDDLAEPEVITIGPRDTVAAALQRMLEEGVDHLPVVEDGRLVGICTRSDVLRTRRNVIALEQAQHGWLERLRTGEA